MNYRSGPTTDSEEETEGNIGDDESEATDTEDHLELSVRSKKSVLRKHTPMMTIQKLNQILTHLLEKTSVMIGQKILNQNHFQNVISLY